MKYKKIIWYAALIVVTFWFLYPTVIVHQASITAQNDIRVNEFGDLYGALNTLFSGLAFVGIIASIFIQSEELNDTRREIAKQTEQFKSQTDALNKQNFENTYFKLLSLNNEILKLATVDYNVREFGTDNNYSGQGREAFKKLSEAFGAYRRVNYHYDIKYAFESFHKNVEDVLGHYFRTIYQCLKLIDGSLLCDYQKKEYANMLRAQISKHELELLYYNCICKLGCDKFKPLLEKYEFFEHLSSDIYIKDDYLLYYNISAFGFSNRKYFEAYLHALAKKAVSEDREVYCYVELHGHISKKTVSNASYNESDFDENNIHINIIGGMLSKRTALWIEVK